VTRQKYNRLIERLLECRASQIGLGRRIAKVKKSVACLQAASKEELEVVAGKRKAALVKQYFVEKAD
jgi:hypothetical protein